MSTYFKEVANDLLDNTPEHFLTIIKRLNIIDKEEFFIFQTPTLEDNFYQSLIYLADDDIWTKEELADFVLVAQTIDNDYILANQTQTLIIPYSFYKRDSEYYELPIGEFFKEYENHQIQSTILPSK